MSFRWTTEAVEAFEKRMEKYRGTVRTHICKGPSLPALLTRGKGVKSRLEQAMVLVLVSERISGFIRQHRPLPPRKWSLDIAWPELKTGIEVQGGVHRIKDKFQRDIEKRAELMLAGWRVLEVDAASIESGQALAWVKRLLA